MVGDFNHDSTKLHAEAQMHAQRLWGVEPVATCKHATIRDYIWMSPEVLELLASVAVQEVFTEHSTLVVGLKVPCQPPPRHCWPLPAEIPWSCVDRPAWHAHAAPAALPDSDPTKQFAALSRHAERSLAGFVKDAPEGRLPSRCFGRGQRLKPTSDYGTASLRASRPGEECVRHDFLGREVQRWFKQLRRIQSLLQSARAGKDTLSAVSYRASLWKSIRHAPGFQGGFACWWQRRSSKLVGSPACIHHALPPLSVIERIFDDFRNNYRAFEHWHLRRRCQVLDSRHQASMSQLFCELRPDRPDQLDTLTVRNEYAILAVEPDEQLIHIDPEPDLRGFSTWTLDSAPVSLSHIADSTCKLECEFVPDEGDVLVQMQVLVTHQDVQEEFIKLWKPRWQRHANLPAGTWARITHFAQAFLPSVPLALAPITMPQWKRALRRFKPRAARGPCGWSKQDLLSLPDVLTAQLLELLHAVEDGKADWPSQLLEGLVCSLSKQNDRHDANGFRPIVLYSMIYRCWAGIRSRQLLRLLRQYLLEELFGFVPHHEAQELRYALQMQIEACCQSSASIYGFSTDVVKAFNHLPREPIAVIARRNGIPESLLTPWFGFLRGMQRRFKVGTAVSAPLTSVTGFPEGCPLSPLAMLLADWALHRYMAVFAPEVRCLSFVDNWSATAFNLAAIARGFSAATTFCEVMDLSLDLDKSFMWSNKASSKPALAQLGLPVISEARELGGLPCPDCPLPGIGTAVAGAQKVSGATGQKVGCSSGQVLGEGHAWHFGCSHCRKPAAVPAGLRHFCTWDSARWLQFLASSGSCRQPATDAQRMLGQELRGDSVDTHVVLSRISPSSFGILKLGGRSRPWLLPAVGLCPGRQAYGCQDARFSVEALHGQFRGLHFSGAFL